KHLYESVWLAKRLAEQMSEQKAKTAEIFAVVDKFLKKSTGFGLVHGLGHGLGIEVHDMPMGFLKDSKETLQQGNVLTAEPAIYGSFGGIRIEDIVVVTARGAKPLSSAPKKLVEL
ncbi:unnamed protein product, partial [marine sediment metagenome]